MKHKISNSLDQVSSSGIFSGYACTFGMVDDHNERILPGAFVGSLNAKTIKLLWQHKSEFPIGTILSIDENEHGLFVVAKLLLELEKAREVYSMIKNGIVDSLSIGYRVLKSKFGRDNINTLVKLDLLEISPVVFPANSAAKILQVKKGFDKETHDTIKLLDRATVVLSKMDGTLR